MAIGLIGQKCGMTRIFTDAGVSIPVTVIQVKPNLVSQVKTTETDGYNAIQVSAGGEKKLSRVNKAELGHFNKSGVKPSKLLKEFTISADKIADYKEADEITVEIFAEGQKVDVTGVSKGKGFSGVIKRHNFSMQDATHGNSKSHRSAGSIGQNQDPGKVFKGKKMAGQYGNKKCTVQTLEVASIDKDNALLLIKGAVPGATGSTVVVKHAVKVGAEV